MGEKVDKMMKDDLQEGFIQSMDEEVAEDTSNSAMFISRDEVQNVMEDNDILMQENNVKEMRGLWKNLREHNSIAGCSPWVLLGDVNLGGVLVKGFLKWTQVMGNGHFVSDFSNSFANFLPFASFDHSPAILVMPADVVRPTSVCTSWNGIFNMDEELFYADAYKKAARDEELLVKQKSKIQWLKEGDFNTVFFHNMVKGRVTKNRIEVIYDDVGNAIHGSGMIDVFVSYFKKFFGTCEAVFPIDDPGNLFTKKLDAGTALDLIKPISDC
ncbi:hypothetical protein Tco_0455100 [Tanacetum coccineum]